MATTADSSPTRGSGGFESASNSRRSLPSAWAQVVRGEQESLPSPASVNSSALVVSVEAAAPRSPSSPPPPQPLVPEKTLDSSSKASFSADCSAMAAPVPSGESGNVGGAHDESSAESNGNAAAPKRPAWNKPVNGVIEPVKVMGDTVSWPALSESTRPGPRSMTEAPRPPPSDGSVSAAAQGPIVNVSQPRQGNANTNASTINANHSVPARQRSSRHRGGNYGSNAVGGGAGQSGFTRPPPPPPPMPPPFPVFDVPYGNVLPPPPPPTLEMDPSVRAPRSMGGMGSQPHGTNDHSSQRNSSRRGGFGDRPRGDGSHHNNHGGRRDQDRRDVHVAPFGPPPAAFIPPPPPGTPPYGPVPMRPFHGPMGFDMAGSQFIYALPPDSFRGMPLVPPGPPIPMFYPVMESNLPASIVKQIEYYFSDDNLVKDNFLRENMDHEGWVPISLIAKFPRVAQLTTSTHLILDSLRPSSVVEVQADKVRRRDDWGKWIRPSVRSSNDSAVSTAVAGTSVDNALATSMQTVSLEEATSSRGITTTNEVNAQAGESLNKLSTRESTSQSTLANNDSKASDESSS